MTIMFALFFNITSPTTIMDKPIRNRVVMHTDFHSRRLVIDTPFVLFLLDSTYYDFIFCFMYSSYLLYCGLVYNSDIDMRQIRIEDAVHRDGDLSLSRISSYHHIINSERKFHFFLMKFYIYLICGLMFTSADNTVHFHH
jgi:hypothetical protein